MIGALVSLRRPQDLGPCFSICVALLQQLSKFFFGYAIIFLHSINLATIEVDILVMHTIKQRSYEGPAVRNFCLPEKAGNPLVMLFPPTTGWDKL